MKTKRVRRGAWIYFWWSASEVLGVRFERWCRMRRHCGGKDSDKIGVGAIVSSTWCFSKPCVPRIPHGLRRGQYRLRPYTDLYSSREDAYAYRNPIVRPPLGRVNNEAPQVTRKQKDKGLMVAIRAVGKEIRHLERKLTKKKFKLI